MKKLPRVSAVVSRYSSTDGCGLHLSVTDEESGLTIVDAYLPGKESIADFFTNSTAYGDATVFPESAAVYGLKMEHKDVSVPCGKWEQGWALKACAVAEKENPGWQADESSKQDNHHRRRDSMARVTLRRWVKP